MHEPWPLMAFLLPPEEIVSRIVYSRAERSLACQTLATARKATSSQWQGSGKPD